MNRIFLPAIILLFSLSACLPLPGEQRGSPTDEVEKQAMDLFIVGIDQFDANHRSEAFLQLEQTFPNHAWNRRGKVLAGLAGSIRLLEKQLNRQQSLIDLQKNNQQTITELTQENTLLQEQVKVLKSLIIDLELNQP